MPIVEFAFTAGLDQGTDPRRTVKLTSLSNYVWTKRGMIEKRPGYATISTVVYPAQVSQVTSVTLTAGGSGYQPVGFVVPLIGGGGAGAEAFAFTGVSGGAVLALLGLGGSGYTSAPTPSFALGSGSGASATSTIGTVGVGPLTDAKTLAVTPQGILQTTDANNLYAYDGSSSWANLAPLPNVAITTTPVPIQTEPTNTSGATLIDAVDWLTCVCGDLRIWWSYDLFTIQAASGATIFTNGLLLGEIEPMTLVTDGITTVWFFEGAATNVTSYFLLPGAAGTPQRTTASTPSTITSTKWFDAAWNSVTSQLIVAFISSGATVSIQSWTWSATIGSWSIGNFSANVVLSFASLTMNALSVSIGASGTAYVACAWVDTSGSPLDTHVRVVQVNPTTGTFGTVDAYAQVAATVCASIENVSIVETGGAGVYTVGFTALERIPSSTSTVTNTLYAVSVAAGAVTLGCKAPILALGSRLWAIGSKPCAISYHAAAQTYYVHDLTGLDSTMPPALPPTPMGIINPRAAFSSLSSVFTKSVSGVLQSPWALPSPTMLSATKVQVPVTLAPEPAASAILNEQIATIDFAPARGVPASEWTNLIYPAGIPTVAGVATTFAAQFMAPPVIVLSSAGGSGSLSTGNYSWIATYAHVFEDGSIIEGPPSAPASIQGVTAGQGATLTISQYGLTRDPPIDQDVVTIVVVYRTQANGTTYTRVVADPFTTYVTGSYMPNNPKFNALPFTDGFSDASIASNVELYTEGGVFDNVIPPTCANADRVRDRVYMSGSPDGFTLYYSDPVTNAGSANFHDEQSIVIDDGGPITGVCALNSNTVIFKTTAIYVMYGTEGTNTGAGNTLTAPAILVAGIGCIAHNSILYTAPGIWFQSARGLELLDLNMTVEFAGEPVKDLTNGQTVVSAIDYPAQRQIRFFLASGAVLVYSTLTGEWSSFAYPSITGTTTAATLYGGNVAWASAGPTIQVETPGAYSDNGAWITSSWTGGWLTIGEGLQGYRRYEAFELLGTWNGECGITITVAADYALTPSQTEVRTSTQLLAIPGFDSSRLQLEVRPVVAKAEAVQVAVTDMAPADATLTKGVAWESLTFEVFAKQGRYRGLSSAAKG